MSGLEEDVRTGRHSWILGKLVSGALIGALIGGVGLAAADYLIRPITEKVKIKVTKTVYEKREKFRKEPVFREELRTTKDVEHIVKKGETACGLTEFYHGKVNGEMIDELADDNPHIPRIDNRAVRSRSKVPPGVPIAAYHNGKVVTIEPDGIPLDYLKIGDKLIFRDVPSKPHIVSVETGETKSVFAGYERVKVDKTFTEYEEVDARDSGYYADIAKAGAKGAAIGGVALAVLLLGATALARRKYRAAKEEAAPGKMYEKLEPPKKEAVPEEEGLEAVLEQPTRPAEVKIEPGQEDIEEYKEPPTVERIPRLDLIAQTKPETTPEQLIDTAVIPVEQEPEQEPVKETSLAYTPKLDELLGEPRKVTAPPEPEPETKPSIVVSSELKTEPRARQQTYSIEEEAGELPRVPTSIVSIHDIKPAEPDLEERVKEGLAAAIPLFPEQQPETADGYKALVNKTILGSDVYQAWRELREPVTNENESMEEFRAVLLSIQRHYNNEIAASKIKDKVAGEYGIKPKKQVTTSFVHDALALTYNLSKIDTPEDYTGESYTIKRRKFDRKFAERIGAIDDLIRMFALKGNGIGSPNMRAVQASFEQKYGMAISQKAIYNTVKAWEEREKVEVVGQDLKTRQGAYGLYAMLRKCKEGAVEPYDYEEMARVWNEEAEYTKKKRTADGIKEAITHLEEEYQTPFHEIVKRYEYRDNVISIFRKKSALSMPNGTNGVNSA